MSTTARSTGNAAMSHTTGAASGAVAPELHEGRVVGLCGEEGEAGGGEAKGGEATVRVQAGPWMLVARRSASCLLAPTAGDRVLLAMIAREAFVLAVLEREDPTARTSITTEGDLDLVSRGGRVSVRGADGVALEGAAVTATAARIALAADTVDVASRAFALVAELAQTRLGAAKLVARTADAVLERLFVRAERAFRQVETLDQVRAGQIDMVAKDCAMLRGEHTIVGADGMVKVDGEQVHIG